ncbi:MAG: hypothetical protein ABWY54_00205 [Glaciihabitans sp.]
MSQSSTLPTVIAAAIDPIGGVLLAVGTGGGIVVIGFLVGIGLLFRRRSRTATALRAPANAALGIEELSRRAGAVLVRADDAVEAAENEVGFALAQFGEDQTRPFAAAVTAARADVAEAFRIKQQLDDAYPESEQQRRDMTKRVIALGEAAQRVITEQSDAFTTLRRSEADSPARLAALRSGITDTRSELARSRSILDELTARYDPALLAEVRANPEKADALLIEATRLGDDAQSRISDTGVNTVSDDLEAAAERVHTARSLLAAVAETAASLRQADHALQELVAGTRADLVEARRARDTAPDASTGSALVNAVAEVERALESVTSSAGSPTDTAHPVAGLERLGAAVATLDTALAGARNQQQRLEHARTALVGALIAARSQIDVAKNFMAGGRSDVDARTRLAEAERQLMLAETEADPVAALDAARRATTAAQDADALARYRAM